MNLAWMGATSAAVPSSKSGGHQLAGDWKGSKGRKHLKAPAIMGTEGGSRRFNHILEDDDDDVVHVVLVQYQTMFFRSTPCRS